MSIRLPSRNEIEAYVSTLYRQYQPVIGYIHDAHTRVPLFADFLRRQAMAAFQTSKSFLWANKELLIGGAAIGMALWMIYQTRKNRAVFPTVEMKTSLDVASLRIEAAKGKPEPPCATLVFCMDVSGSMNTSERAGTVKKAIGGVLDDAQKVIGQFPGAKIQIAIVGFDNQSRSITSLTQLGEVGVVEAVKEQVNGIGFGGGTNILSGLELAVQDLNDASGIPTVILLTDGEDSVVEDRLGFIHRKLNAVQAKLFAIGIGTGHSQTTLEKIIQGVRGKYIDASAGAGTIERAITEIYQEAISNYAEIELSAPSLPPGSWSVAGASVQEDKCVLGSLAEGKAMEKTIRIQSTALPGVLDLASVSFVLTFIDPKGRRGKMQLAWSPHSKIYPELIKAGRI